MAKPTRATQAKRNRELSKLDKRREKEEKRAQKKRDDKTGSPTGQSEEDPDIAGIVPGPQPILE